MKPLDDILHALGIETTTTVAGVVGGLLSLAFAERTGLVGKITAVVGGWACASFLTPYLRSYFEIAGPGGGVAFLLGLFGMLIVSSLANVIKTLELGPIVSDLVRKWTGTK